MLILLLIMANVIPFSIFSGWFILKRCKDVNFSKSVKMCAILFWMVPGIVVHQWDQKSIQPAGAIFGICFGLLLAIIGKNSNGIAKRDIVKSA
jgi:hypothetical protein